MNGCLRDAGTVLREDTIWFGSLAERVRPSSGSRLKTHSTLDTGLQLACVTRPKLKTRALAMSEDVKIV
jgi:hypothetical protein